MAKVEWSILTRWHFAPAACSPPGGAWHWGPQARSRVGRAIRGGRVMPSSPKSKRQLSDGQSRVVEEPFVVAELEVDEPNLACILGEPETTVPADPIISAVDAEAMQVRVAPAEDDLDDVMELGEGAATTDQDPPPDHGADLPDPEMDLVDGRISPIGHDLDQGNRRRARWSAPDLARSPIAGA